MASAHGLRSCCEWTTWLAAPTWPQALHSNPHGAPRGATRTVHGRATHSDPTQNLYRTVQSVHNVYQRTRNPKRIRVMSRVRVSESVVCGYAWQAPLTLRVITRHGHLACLQQANINMLDHHMRHTLDSSFIVSLWYHLSMTTRRHSHSPNSS